MKVLIEEIYEGDMGPPYARVTFLNSEGVELASITVVDDRHDTPEITLYHKDKQLFRVREVRY